jgi:hypothetical protein
LLLNVVPTGKVTPPKVTVPLTAENTHPFEPDGMVPLVLAGMLTRVGVTVIGDVVSVPVTGRGV